MGAGFPAIELRVLEGLATDHSRHPRQPRHLRTTLNGVRIQVNTRIWRLTETTSCMLLGQSEHQSRNDVKISREAELVRYFLNAELITSCDCSEALRLQDPWILR